MDRSYCQVVIGVNIKKCKYFRRLTPERTLLLKKNSKEVQRKTEWRVYRRRKRRKLYETRRNIRRNERKYRQPRSRMKINHFKRREARLKLPAKFSFIQNPEEVLRFFGELRKHAENNTDVVLDFADVQTLTPDVIPLLCAKVVVFAGRINVHGNRPRKKELDQMLLESGFYKLVGISRQKPRNALLEMHREKIVMPLIAADARRLTAEKTFGDPELHLQPLYRTLIECMANTQKHADSQPSRISWWLSVYHDPLTRVTSFSFCDAGVGIFKSTKIKKLAKFAMTVGFWKNKDILKRILDGKIESSTGLHYRGKGLPKIYSDYKNKSIKRLFIVANDVFADFDGGTFIELKNQLNGTFLYWEIFP